MTEYKVGDVVRATSAFGAVIEAALVEAWGDPMIPFIGYTVADAPNGGWTVELIKAAPSATRKALDDAPRNSVVVGNSTSRQFWKSRNLRWYELNADYEDNPPSLEEVTPETLEIIAGWIDRLPQFSLVTPYGA